MDAGPDSLRNASKKVDHKTGECLGNKILDAATNSFNDKIVKQEPVGEIIIPLEKREEILNDLRKTLI